MNLDDIRKKYLIDFKFRTLNETKEASSGKQSETFAQRREKAIKQTGIGNISEKIALRYKIAQPTPEYQKRMNEIIKVRRALETMKMKTNRLISSVKNRNLIYYLTSLGETIDKGNKVLTVVENSLKNT